MIKIFHVFIVAALLSSCVSLRQMTHEEWLQVGQRKYTNTDKEKVLKAAEQILILADGDDFKFSKKTNGFVGVRTWSIFLVLSAQGGTDYWDFELKEDGKDLVAHLKLTSTAGMLGTAAARSNVNAFATPTPGNPPYGTAIYDLFWSRLDYMVGLKSTWTDCNDAHKKKSRNETWGNLGMLCEPIITKDDYPDTLSLEEVNRLFKDEGKRWKYIRKHYPAEFEEQLKKDPSLSRYK